MGDWAGCRGWAGCREWVGWTRGPAVRRAPVKVVQRSGAMVSTGGEALRVALSCCQLMCHARLADRPLFTSSCCFMAAISSSSSLNFDMAVDWGLTGMGDGGGEGVWRCHAGAVGRVPGPCWLQRLADRSVKLLACSQGGTPGRALPGGAVRTAAIAGATKRQPHHQALRNRRPPGSPASRARCETSQFGSPHQARRGAEESAAREGGSRSVVERRGGQAAAGLRRHSCQGARRGLRPSPLPQITFWCQRNSLTAPQAPRVTLRP